MCTKYTEAERQLGGKGRHYLDRESDSSERRKRYPSDGTFCFPSAKPGVHVKFLAEIKEK